MSTNTSRSEKESDTSCLSPVASPGPQVTHQANVNLTGVPRKVKDMAADLHNLALKWESLNTKGMNLITQISNILIEKVFNTQYDPSEQMEPGKHWRQEPGRETCTTVPPMELNPICDLLTNVVEAMGAIEVKMHHKVEMAEGLTSLQKLDKQNSDNSVLFSTMNLAQIACTVKEIYQNFKQELMFKRELIKQVAFAEDRSTAMFYSTCWMHQPYMQSSCRDHIQALLKETGHVI